MQITVHRLINITLMTVIMFYGVTHCRDCKFMDIRNNATSLKQLEGCTAVIGFLQILLMDKEPAKNFENYSFPELREVTGFVLLYRVPGILSLRKLFPNLGIIRGNQLFMNYALVFYEMDNITEIGLPSLQNIMRGNVRIQRCPRICDANTYNWNKIIDRPNNTFQEYGKKCDRTPKEVHGTSNKICSVKGNQTKCYVPNAKLPKERPLSECHELCIIGCHNKTARGCYACKGPMDDGVCVEKCPETKIYDQDFMRCLTREQCRSIHRKFIFEEGYQCVTKCPKGYTEMDNNFVTRYDHKCLTCDPCPRVCPTTDINYVEDAYKLHGCNIVNGSVKINLNIAADRPDLMDELRRYFESIEEIHGILKIHKSYPLTSLDFLKHLKIIHGKIREEHEHYALLIYENSNLQALWTPRPDFQILNGSILFSSNDKLCPYVVETFLDTIGHNTSKINIESNGNRHSCNSTIIDVKSNVLSPKSVKISWEPFPVGPNERLVGYLINYAEAIDKNVTHYYGTYSCTVSAWNTKSVKVSDAVFEEAYLSFNLTRLAPMTQYAYYVRTDFEGNSHRKQGQSPIRYFQTPVNSLTQVLKLRTYAKTSTSITLQWNLVPKEANFIKWYSVDILRQPDDQVIYGRDFCKHPHDNSAYEEMQEILPGTYECCCENEEEDLEYGSWDESTEEDDTFESDGEQTIADVTKYKYYVTTTLFMPNQTNGNRYEITGLKPFTLYSFQFFACKTAEVCSQYAFHSDRTRPDSSDIIEVSVQQNGEHNETIHVEIEMKNETNGAIVGYIMEERREIQENVLSTHRHCFSLVQNLYWNHTFILSPGVVQLRFQTISLAGLGQLTDWFNITVLEAQEKPSSFGRFGISLIIASFICGSFYAVIWIKHNYRKIFRQKPPVDRNELEMLVLGIHESNIDDELPMQEISLENVQFKEADFY